jgi:hypothetical protein
LCNEEGRKKMLEGFGAETGDVGFRWGKVRPKGAAYVGGSEVPNKEGRRGVSHTPWYLDEFCLLHGIL